MVTFKVQIESKSRHGSSYVHTSRHQARTGREAVIAAMRASDVIEDVTTVTVRITEAVA